MDQKIVSAIQTYCLEWNYFLFKTASNLHMAFAHKLEKKPIAIQENQKVEEKKTILTEKKVEPREDFNPSMTGLAEVEVEELEILRKKNLAVRTPYGKLPKKYFQFLGHILVDLSLMQLINLDGDAHSELFVGTNWRDDPDPGGGGFE